MKRAEISEHFRIEQETDPSLVRCRDEAKLPKSQFFKRNENGLLYRRKTISGFNIQQLIVPTSKRLEIIQTAHDSEFSYHYGILKTTQRIVAHFFWPTMKPEIEKYVSHVNDMLELRSSIESP
jgi:Integrase zinc binding domain